MGNGSNILEGASGERVKGTSKGKQPILFVLDQVNDKRVPPSGALDFSNPDSIKLWVINFVPELFIKHPDATWRRHRTDFEGCLTERERIMIDKDLCYPWRRLLVFENDGSTPQKYSIYYSTCDFPDKADFSAICEEHKLKSELELEEKTSGDVKRPYHEGKDQFPSELCVIRIPTTECMPDGTAISLPYWQSVLFKSSTDSSLNPYKYPRRYSGSTGLGKKELCQSEWEALQKILADMRGSESLYKRDNKELLKWSEEDFPKTSGSKYEMDAILPDQVWSPESMRRRPVGAGVTGPLWFHLISESADQEAQKKAPVGAGANAAQAIVPSKTSGQESTLSAGVVGANMHRSLYRLNPVYKLPTAIKVFPPVDDPIIANIENDLYAKLKTGDILRADVEGVMADIIKRNVADTPYAQYTEILKRYFQYEERGSCWDDCIMNALANCSMHWYQDQRSLDISREKIEKKEETDLLSSLTVYFATLSDAFSESLFPRHVYFQLRDWWQNIKETDPGKDILNSTEIQVIGFSSEAGKSSLNERLRLDRAWKTAQSLKLVFEGVFKSIDVKPFSDRPTSQSKGQKGNVTIYYQGEDLREYPPLALTAPAGGMTINVLPDEIVKRTTVIRTKNDQEDKVAIVIFKKSIAQDVKQYTETFTREETAYPVYGYRVLYPAQDVRISPRLRRYTQKMLIYVVPGQWS